MLQSWSCIEFVFVQLSLTGLPQPRTGLANLAQGRFRRFAQRNSSGTRHGTETCNPNFSGKFWPGTFVRDK